MNRIAVYPGTFDPVTNGHIDLIERSLRIFDEVIVAVAANPKKTPLFTLDKRVAMIKEATSHFKNVVIDGFDVLLMDYMKQKNAVGIVRGLRAVSDFEYELQMALMNRRLNSSVETVFMMPSEEYSYLTSSIVKEVASYCGDVSGLVPKGVMEMLQKKCKQ